MLAPATSSPRATPAHTSGEPVIRAERLTKRFGDEVAVNAVSPTVPRGKIFAASLYDLGPSRVKRMMACACQAPGCGAMMRSRCRRCC